MRKHLTRRLVPSAAAVAVTLLTLSGTAAADAWPNDPQGALARDIAGLYWIFFTCAVIVFGLVTGALIYAGIRFRERPGHVAKQFHGNVPLEIVWTAIPAMMVVTFAVLGFSHLGYINASSDAEMTIKVEGRQFAWVYTYPAEPSFLTREGKPLQTAETVHIPTGTKVRFELTAKDVIHSFFIPSLGGHKDAVPGRTTNVWIEADQPGTYKGQCSELCGSGHADMLITVVAHAKNEYATWAKGALDDYNRLNGPEVAKGRETFLANACVGCHLIQGTTAAGKVGPELTHIASKPTIAGVMNGVNADNLTKWLKNPQAVKPGTQMPNLGLSDQTIADIVSYLLTLK